MRAKVASILACLSILLTLFVFTAAPVMAAEPNGICSNIGGNNLWNGLEMEPINYSYTRGVRAVIADEDALYRCTGIDADNGAMYWIALAPDTGGNFNTILQIGVIHCYDTFAPGEICDDGGENTQHIFWAGAGCNGYTPTPMHMANAPDGQIEFVIYRQTGGTGMYVLAAYNWNGSRGSLIASQTIHHNNARITCWINEVNNVEPEWFCERWDGNDGCGDDGNKVTFHGMTFQNSTGGEWLSPGEGGNGETLTDGDCFESTSEDFCDMLDADSMQLWTQQGS